MSKPRFYCTPDALCSAHEAGAPAGPCGIHPIPVDAAEIARLVALLATPWPRSVAGKTRRAKEDLAAKQTLAAAGLDEQGRPVSA